MRTGSIVVTLALLPTKGIRSAFPDYPFDNGELKTRAGYYTEGGRYRGGIPQFDNIYELFACTELNYEDLSDAAWGNATVCMTWTSNKVGSYESQFGRCTCQSAMNAAYCDAWACSDLEAYEAPCDGNDSTCVVEKSVHSTRCACESEDDSGNFCSSWVCLETNYDDGREYGDYNCVRASPSEEYCDAWTGLTESSNEVEISACECVHASTNSTVCVQWDCKSRSLKNCSHAGTGWCDLGFSIGIGGLLGSLGAALAAMGLSRLRKRDPPVSRACAGLDILLGSLWMAAWSVGVVVWGGEDGTTSVAFWWGGILVIGLLCCCCNTRP